MNFLKKLFSKNKTVTKLLKPARERLRLIYYIETDKTKYHAYETQTSGYDWVNIEIEEQGILKNSLILKEEIVDDSWGTMGGDSFYSLVMSSKRHLKDYIKNKKEFIKFESELL